MIDLSIMAGRTVAVLGLAKSGMAAATALKAGGAVVWAWDDQAAGRERAEAAGIPAVDLMAADWSKVDSLVISPGIPLTHPTPHPVALRAREAGIEIIGDIELLWRAQPDATYVGITGTNGKSTTTALIGHVLTAAGRKVGVGGNLGTPVLTLPALGADGIYVLEMSSFQLDLIPSLKFDVSLLLNMTPDHLDRHGGMDGYIAAKKHIFGHQTAADTAILSIDDAVTTGIANELKGPRVLRISGDIRVPGGVYANGSQLVDDLNDKAVSVLDLVRAPNLPGRHNAQNAAAAYAVVRALGIAPDVAAAAIQSFPGLAHRQERIAQRDGVVFVNDSKATNADAAARALACYDAIYWIAGGVPKAGGIESLVEFFPRIRHAFLIGQAAQDFARTLDGRAPYTLVGDLAHAVPAAFARARADKVPGAVVLLSPACASYDQYSGFEARGEHFRALVADLAMQSPQAQAAQSVEAFA